MSDLNAAPAPDPLGEASQHAVKTTSEILTMLTTAARVHFEVSSRQEQAASMAQDREVRASEKAQRDVQQMEREEQLATDRARREEREHARAAREALRDEARRARAQYAPALDAEYLATAKVEEAVRLWALAEPWATEEADAGRAMRAVEGRLAELHPEAMRGYREEVSNGMEPVDAMMRQVPRIQADLTTSGAESARVPTPGPGTEPAGAGASATRDDAEDAASAVSADQVMAQREGQHAAAVEREKVAEDTEAARAGREGRRTGDDGLGDRVGDAAQRVEDAARRSSSATRVAEAAAAGDDTAAGLAALERAMDATGDTLAEVQRLQLEEARPTTAEAAELVETARIARREAEEARASGSADAGVLDDIALAVETEAARALVGDVEPARPAAQGDPMVVVADDLSDLPPELRTVERTRRAAFPVHISDTPLGPGAGDVAAQAAQVASQVPKPPPPAPKP
jgi:hypothetical protein